MSDRPPTDLTKQVYANTVEANHRRTAVEARVEGTVLRQLLTEYLPTHAPQVVLDIGGGSGGNATYLQTQGHQVHLCDLTMEVVRDAVRRQDERGIARLASIVQADARALPYADDIADSALLLGPLYSIPERHGRVAALRAVARTVRPGGMLIAQTFTRTGGLRLLQQHLPGHVEQALSEDFLASGRFPRHLPSPLLAGSSWLTVAEVRSEAAAAGLVQCRVQPLDAPAPEAQARLRNAPQDVIDRWAALARQLPPRDEFLGSANSLAWVWQIATR